MMMMTTTIMMMMMIMINFRRFGRHSLFDHVEFRLDYNHVRDRPCVTVFRIKIERNSCIIVKLNAILGVLTIYAN